MVHPRTGNVAITVVLIHFVLGSTSVPPNADISIEDQKPNDAKEEDSGRTEGRLQPNDAKEEDNGRTEGRLQPREATDPSQATYDNFGNTVSYMNFFQKAGFLGEQQEGSDSFKKSPFLKRFRDFLSQEVNRELAPSESIHDDYVDLSSNSTHELNQSSLVPSNATFQNSSDLLNLKDPDPKESSVIELKLHRAIEENADQNDSSSSVAAVSTQEKQNRTDEEDTFAGTQPEANVTLDVLQIDNFVENETQKSPSSEPNPVDLQAAADSSSDFPKVQALNSAGVKQNRTEETSDANVAASSSEFLKLQRAIDEETKRLQSKAKTSGKLAFGDKMDRSHKKDTNSDIEYPSSDDDYPDIKDIPSHNEVPSYEALQKTYNEDGYLTPAPSRATSSFGIEKYHIPKTQANYPLSGSESFNNFEYPSLKQRVYSAHPYTPTTRSKHGAPQVNEDPEEYPQYGDPSDFIGIGQYPSDYVIHSAEEPEADYYDDEKSPPPTGYYPYFTPQKKKKPSDEDDYDFGDGDDEDEDGEKKDKDEYYDEGEGEPDADYTNVQPTIKALDSETKESKSISSKRKPDKDKKKEKKSTKKILKAAPMLLPALPIMAAMARPSSPIKHCTLKNKTVEPARNESSNATKQASYCYTCINFANGEKTEQCVNKTLGKPEDVLSTTPSEKKDDAKVRVARQVIVRRWMPQMEVYPRETRRRAPRRDEVDAVDFDFEHHGEDIENDDLDFFSDEDGEAGSDVDEYLPPAESLREMDDGSCKKVRKNGLNCLVCEKANSAGTFEQCSYESDPKENAYEYSTKETYGSKNRPSERYRRSRVKKDINLRNSPFDSGLLPKGPSIGRGKIDLLGRNNGFKSDLGKSYSLSGSSDDDFSSSVFPDVKVPGLGGGKSNHFSNEFSSDLDAAIKPESDFLPGFASKSSLNSGGGLFKKQRPSLFDNRPQLRLKPEKNSYDSLLGDFTAKDRSHCKKEIKDGSTCYYCTDDEGSEHEECMYVKKSQPENKEVKYHQSKEVKTPLRGHKAADKFDEILNSNTAHNPVYRQNDEGMDSVEDFEEDVESTYAKHEAASPGFYHEGSPAMSTVSRTDFKGDESPTGYRYNTQHTTSPNGREDSVPTQKPSSRLSYGMLDYPTKPPPAPVDADEDLDNLEPGVGGGDTEPLGENSSNNLRHHEARSDDDVQLVYDNRFKMTLPKFMVEKTEQEDEFDSTYTKMLKNIDKM
nr:PREDICTED: uncharacterized protein LOC109039828 [Bemisia tabaci]